MTVCVAGQQAGVVSAAVVEIADHVHRSRIRRPNAKGGAIGDKIRAHGRAGMDVVERCGH